MKPEQHPEREELTDLYLGSRTEHEHTDVVTWCQVKVPLEQNSGGQIQ